MDMNGINVLSTDNKRLIKEVIFHGEISNTIARDLMESITRGDVDQSSFAFTVQKETWEDDEGKNRDILFLEFFQNRGFPSLSL